MGGGLEDDLASCLVVDVEVDFVLDRAVDLVGDLENDVPFRQSMVRRRGGCCTCCVKLEEGARVELIEGTMHLATPSAFMALASTVHHAVPIANFGTKNEAFYASAVRAPP